jgi:cytochrome c oxidase assembly protein subunit 15
VATDPQIERASTPRWLHYWAVLTVCAAVPLLLLGAEVTTKKVGMVDPVGMREPWHLFVVFERAMREIGLLIEHSHRLMGYIEGCCIIVLAIGLWRCEPRRWVRWLGAAALAGVCIQGFLGKYRVDLNAYMGTELAWIHGCFAQLVLATLVCLAVCTSRGWFDVRQASLADSPRLRHWTILISALIYLQLILGGWVRHAPSSLGQRGHFIVAFAVVAAVVWLIKLTAEYQSHGALSRGVTLLGILVALQIMLGVEAWMLKFAAGTALADTRPIGAREEVIRTAHFLVGSGTFATAVAVAIGAHRQVAWSFRFGSARVSRVEGVV